MTNSQTTDAPRADTHRRGDPGIIGTEDTLETRISRAVENLKNPRPDVFTMRQSPMDEGRAEIRPKRRKMTEWEKRDALDGFLIVILPSMAIFAAWCWAMVTSVEQKQVQDALEYKRLVAVAMKTTAAGCPAVRARIREMGSDGKYFPREIEVVNALVLIEQGKPDGLRLCRAPSWQRMDNRWLPSEGYAR